MKNTQQVGSVTVTNRTASVLKKMLAFQRDHQGLSFIGVERVSLPEVCQCCGHTHMLNVNIVQDAEGNFYRIGSICKDAVTGTPLKEVIGYV